MSTIISTMLGEFCGPLTPQQRELLERAFARCDESLECAGRLMTIARALEHPETQHGVAEISRIIRDSIQRHFEKATSRNIELRLELPEQTLFVQGLEASLSETMDELINNALKYTPDHGLIRIEVVDDVAHRQVFVTLEDSGPGIPEEARPRIFDPFYRTPTAIKSGVAGTGLGLAMVKAIILASGGTISVGKSPLGGASFEIRLPSCPWPDSVSKADLDYVSMRVVIIGGVAAGPKVAAKLSRLDPYAEISIVEKGKVLSYAGCGLPYYISGIVRDQKQLMSSPAGDVRDPVFFQKVKNIRVLNQTEAVQIDRESKRVLIRDLANHKDAWISYDKLVLATGGKAIVPQIEGIKLKNIFTLHGVGDAEGIKTALEGTSAHDVVIVGGGLIGIEMTEALVRAGCRVTIVESRDQILSGLDWEMARLVERYLESRGVKILTNICVERFEGQEKVHRVILKSMGIPADLVILAVGVQPNVELAIKAGLAVGPTGGIQVNPMLQTSDADIYAAGDCVEHVGLLMDSPIYAPMGSTANKQGRTVAVNLAGGNEPFAGVLSTFVCKLFDYNVGKTGLTEMQAREMGYKVVVVLCPGPDHDHFVPGAQDLLLKLIVDYKSRRILGVQAIGPGVVDKRIDVAATAISGKMTVDQLAHVDLGYAPPFSPVLDNLITAANVAKNKLEGRFLGISSQELHHRMENRDPLLLLDVRTPVEVQHFRLKGSLSIPLGSLRSRLYELPREAEIVTVCNYSLRAYEAAVILRQAGYNSVSVLDGGLSMWPYDLDHSA
ncbi:MAG: FAD-dependent oxidoreductase [Phycisphaerae bacterium]|nr:FAD-dependent oxidoreductase [Phycisphaerae bacterium]